MQNPPPRNIGLCVKYSKICMCRCVLGRGCLYLWRDGRGGRGQADLPPGDGGRGVASGEPLQVNGQVRLREHHQGGECTIIDTKKCPGLSSRSCKTHPGSLVQSREISNISMHQISCLCLTYQSSLIFYWLLHFQIRTRTRGEWLMLNLRFDFCRIF